MDEAKLDQSILELRRRLASESSRYVTRSEDCMTFARAREIVLDSFRETESERMHRSMCRRCERIVSGMLAEIPHLSIWTLARRHLGMLSADELASVQYHLDAGGCRCCQSRAGWLQSATSFLQLPPSAGITPTAAVRAAVPGPTVLFHGGDAGLEVELVNHSGEFTLEVRTRDAQLRHSLVAYALLDGLGKVLLDGFVVLAPDVQGWFAAESTINAEELAAVADGGRSLAVISVPPGSLSPREWERVLACAPSPDAPVIVTQAWAVFAARALESQVPDACRPILERLRALT